MEYQFHWAPVWNALPNLLLAVRVTIEISVLSMLIGMGFAIFLALGRLSTNRWFYRSATVWIEIARNTPALFQIYMAYFGLGSLGIHLESYTAVLFALSFNNAGYMAEVLRGGFETIPHTQNAAAASLGMNKRQVHTYIILPQVIRIVYYPMTNQMIWSILNSSLGMTVGLMELTGATNYQQSLTFRAFEFFTAAAVLYYTIAKLVVGSSRLLAWRIFRE